MLRLYQLPLKCSHLYLASDQAAIFHKKWLNSEKLSIALEEVQENFQDQTSAFNHRTTR